MDTLVRYDLRTTPLREVNTALHKPGVKGEFVIDHPDESVEILARFPGQVEDARKLAWRFKLQNPLFESDYSKKNGPLTMDPEVWSEMIGFLKDGEQIPKTIPVAEVMTNEHFSRE